MKTNLYLAQLLLVFSLLSSTFLFGQNEVKNEWLSNFLTDEAVKNAPISICVSNSFTGEILLNHNATTSITPASTLKLITSAAALEILGAEYRFETTLSVRGEILNRRLNGDIIIKGGGDPSLGSAYMYGKNNRDFLNIWAESILKLGIDSIIGSIIVDPYIYSDQDVPQTWIWEDLANYFGAVAQGISVFDNNFNIVFKTENEENGKTQIIRTEPEIPGIVFQNEVKASTFNGDKTIVYGSPFDSFRIIKGMLPKGREEYKIKASIPSPSMLLAYELKQKLQNMGIFITNESIKKKTEAFQTDSVILKWKSPPLHEIITQLNYESINLFAEHLCKHIGLVELDEGSTKAGVKAITEFWNKKGIDSEFLFMADGSGLSRSNAVSAKTLIEVLNYMKTVSSNSEYFEKSIPLTGMQGTQRYYFQQSFLKGKARAKSGSMTRVRSFAGYMTSQNNTPLSFVIIANNFNCSSFQMAGKMEVLMEEIYRTF